MRLPLCNVQYFNSRPCERGDQARAAKRAGRGYFNSRPCERGDLLSFIPAVVGSVFQFSPLREGRPIKKLEDAVASIFQFSPLREGRQEKPFFQKQVKGISILAPARGATCQCWHILPCRSDFNSRPCERGDFSCAPGFLGLRISILAPARGATKFLVNRLNNTLFQFSPLREGRRIRPQPLGAGKNFNSRPCERGDSND